MATQHGDNPSNTVINVPAANLNISPLGFHKYATEFLAADTSYKQGLGWSPVPYYLVCRTIELALKAFLLAKGNPNPPQNPLPDVQRWSYTGNKSHPTEKAVSIISPLIESFSKPGDLVLAPFSGSGTTAVAAALLGRRYLGIELERRYCELARRRLAGIERRQARLCAA